MLFSTLFAGLALMSTTGWAQYVLEDDYLADGNFFDQFSFWDTADPTNGLVAYQDYQSANASELISNSSTNVQMRVDSSNVTPNGRPSVRITSNKSYDSGLIIVDVEHMPGGICGTWPAFWLVGPDWPNQGEIDIIEGANDQSTNDMTLHTGEGCSITNNGAFSGNLVSTSCASSGGDNQGCQIGTSNTQTYGSGFNANNGGVYATEWTSSAITVFFFPRGSIPSDITDGSPDPSNWGTPLAQFQGGCDIGTNFTNQQIVFDTTFCGDWAGNTWGASSCASKADTCNDYVTNNPEAFADAYWSVNSLKVYQSSGWSSKVASPSAAVSSTVSVAIPSPVSVSWATNFTTISPVSATTFAITTKSRPMFSTDSPKTLSYFTGNTTNATYSTGSYTGSAPTVLSTGSVSSVPVVAPTSTFMSAPSSPPETTSSISSVVDAAPTAATTTAAAAQSYDHTRSWGGHRHYEPSAAAVKRHLRHHKRHGAGRL
ncbi:hypothetical protein LTR08_007989 [Meristemomyces frigidus]|nr:hypothetical protein LTR08_007989 [Meristemomyces frigidus]